MNKPILALTLATISTAALWILAPVDEGQPEPPPVQNLGPLRHPAPPTQARGRSSEDSQAARSDLIPPRFGQVERLPSRAARALERDAPGVPDTFPLDEAQWRDAEADDAGLEPLMAEPLALDAESFDAAWGGQWTDRGGVQ